MAEKSCPVGSVHRGRGVPRRRPGVAGRAFRVESGGKAVAARAVVLMLLSVLTVGCGGHQTTSPSATARDRNPVILGPGRLVAIGGGRSLYLHCEGTGSPTIILEAGFGGTSDNWSEVQGPLSRVTRTCAYDRAGLGNSLPIPGVHDAATEISDLKRLLDHAGIQPPYVLVGHSYGGLLMRMFAHAHPDQTAGIVLVEAMGRNQDLRLKPIWRAQPAQVRQQIPDPTANTIDQGVDLYAGEALDAKIRTLRDTPLAVITRGRPDDSGPSLPPSVRGPADHLWTTMQNELEALSSDHVHVIALRSGHFVQRSANGQPDVVIAAVLAVVHAARTHTHLPACPRLFHAASVECRT
jgi:pimeloyl-ACP methyl ester carboxylesterase